MYNARNQLSSLAQKTEDINLKEFDGVPENIMDEVMDNLEMRKKNL
jgi:hypothetical protein